MKLYWNVLDQRRLSLLPALANWKKKRFYLAGGTALALQLGHRTSFDFDFYSEGSFSPLELIQELGVAEEKISITSQKPGTLLAFVNDIHVSAFYYPYSILKPFIETPNLYLASLDDIAAMKIIAISQRGKKRDFIDMYFLCQQFGLERILNFTRKKYPTFDTYNGLRGLIFFDDAESEKPRTGVKMKSRVSWNVIKSYFRNAVRGKLR